MPHNRRPRIFLATTPFADLDGDLLTIALAEDGKILAQHVSSSVAWARMDMGFYGGGPKIDTYEDHYPNGYEVIDLIAESLRGEDVLGKNPDYAAALTKHHALQEEPA